MSIGMTIFLSVIALAIVKAVIARKINPIGEVAYTGLPGTLREEVERVLPGFRNELARMTKKGNEAWLRGDYQGTPVRVEADLDGNGELIELEIEGPHMKRTRSPDVAAELTAAAAREVNRVLGSDVSVFERRSLSAGTSDGESYFKVEGHAKNWKWEIAVTGDGRLLEVEKEKKNSRH